VLSLGGIDLAAAQRITLGKLKRMIDKQSSRLKTVFLIFQF
jgi:hypothetical protein